GTFSLSSVTTGSFNTAVGAGALDLNTADNNTATGAAALLLNTTGTSNTANGVDALALNDTGSDNTANGAFALFSNITGNNNTAMGVNALLSSISGFRNTAFGRSALASNTASDNTAYGSRALQDNISGSENTAIGSQALSIPGGNDNTAIGTRALSHMTGGNFNIGLGANAGSGVTNATNVICIGGNLAGANVDNSCFISNIRGVQTVNAAVPVVIDTAGQLGTQSSSRRFKHEIKPMDKTSEAILALKPVSFHYKSDSKGTPQFGLIAEEVAEVNPDLVVRDENGEIYTVRYDAVNAMLLNEFLKEHRKNEEQGATIAR